MRDLIVDLLVGFDWFVLGYFLVINTIYLVLVLVAMSVTVKSLRRPAESSHEDIFANPLTPPISIIISAYNEREGIISSTQAALGLRYPQLEVVLVDDGSTDDTFGLLQNEFDLIETVPVLEDDVSTIGVVRSMHVPRSGAPLVVIRKENVGKRADALNVGLNAARFPLVCLVDADSILEGDALLRVAKPFVDDPDQVIATGGVIRAANGSTVYRGELTEVRQPRSWLARIQIIEYLRSFLLGRTGWSRFSGLLIISGAFGLYRRDLLVQVGGYDPTSLGEDADVVVAMHRLKRDQGEPYRIVYVPEPVCWTEVPTTRAVLGRQRRRWAHGLAQVLWKQRGMIGRRRYGRIGLIVMPYFVFFELFGPVFEVAGLAALIVGLAIGAFDLEFAILFGAVAVFYGIALSLASLLVEEVSFHRYQRWRDLWVAIGAAFAENVGYRQMHAWWRLQGLVAAVRGTDSGWGEMTRAGFDMERTSP